MDSEEPQNLNPVIKDLADLPTRLGKRNATSESSPTSSWLFGDFDRPPASLLDPFDAYASSAASDSSSDSSPSYEPIDEQEIFDLISTISDPEHPITLGALSVVNLPDIRLAPLGRDLTRVTVEITPTITHCSLATVIGLGVRVRLEQSLPPRFRVDVRIKEGTHSTGDQVNKQLGDKERVAAALENAQLMSVIRKMMETCQ